jgi:hypothetical protein
MARLHHVHRAHQVDLHHAAEGVGGHAIEARREVARRARNQHVEIAPCAMHPGKPRLDGGQLPHIGGEAHRLRPEAFSAATVSSTLSCDRLATATRAPWRANSSAMPRLMPLVPPTTTTVLPLKSMVMLMTLVLPHAHVVAATLGRAACGGHGKDVRPTPRYSARGMRGQIDPAVRAGAPSPPARREPAPRGGRSMGTTERISHWDGSAVEPDVEHRSTATPRRMSPSSAAGSPGCRPRCTARRRGSTASCWRPSASAMAGRAGTWAS